MNFRIKEEKILCTYLDCSPFSCSDELLEAYYPFTGTWNDLSSYANLEADSSNGGQSTLTDNFVQVRKDSYVNVAILTDVTTGMCARIFKKMFLVFITRPTLF